MLAVGDKAPEFLLAKLDGGKQSLTQLLQQGPVLLVFFKVSCPVCQLALPFLDRIGKGSLPVVAISQDSERAIRQFHKTYGVSLATLLDREEDRYPASNSFGIQFVPTTFLVEPDGVISAVAEGFRKADLESIGLRAGIITFRATENVPAWKAG
jgi:peroxiredoxin